MNTKQKIVSPLFNILFLAIAPLAYTSEQSLAITPNQKVRYQRNVIERPFPCSICNKSFRRKDHAKRHEKAHGPNKFECSMCDKTFAYKSNQNRHMKMHTGEKPYTCDSCGKKFYRSDILGRHKKSYHKKNQKKQPSMHAGIPLLVVPSCPQPTQHIAIPSNLISLLMALQLPPFNVPPQQSLPSTSK